MSGILPYNITIVILSSASDGSADTAKLIYTKTWPMTDLRP